MTSKWHGVHTPGKGMRCVALALAVVALGACGGADARKAEYLERGRQFVREGNPEKARLELKNVLQIDPAHAEARYLLGTLDEQDQRWQDAFINYREAVELDPAHLPARIRLGRLYLLSGKPDKAAEQADAVLAQAPRNAEALVLKAGAMLKGDDLEEALRLAEEALELDPAQTDAVAIQATVHFRQNRPEAVADVLRRGVENNPEHGGLRLLLAQFHAERGQTDKAVELLEELVRREPGNLQYRVTLAELYVRSERPDAAEELLREGVAQAPEDTAAALALLSLLAEQRGAEALTREAAARLAAAAHRYELWFGVARLYEKLGRPEELKETYRQIIARDGKGPHAARARSELALQLAREQQLAEAETLVAEVLAENARDATALLARGRIALMKQDPVGAIADFRAVLKGMPDSVEALRLLAQAHLHKGERDLARDSLQKAVAADPGNTPLRLDLVQLLVEFGDLGAAWDQVQRAMKTAPRDRHALELAARIALARSDWAGALEAAAALKTHHPDDPLGYVLAGVAYQLQDQLDRGTAEFEDALAKRPEALFPISALVANDLKRDDLPKALERVQGFLQRHPDSAPAHNLLGELLLLRQDQEGAERAFAQAIALDDGWPVAYHNLARAYGARAAWKAAIEVYRKALARFPDNVALAFELAVAYEQDGDPEAAIRQYERLLQQAPDLDAAVNNLAMLLALHRNDAASLDRALALAQRLDGTRNPAYLDTLAWVHYRKENYDAAIPLLETALRMEPAPLLRYHLGMAYYRKGDREAARHHLSGAVEAGEDFPGKEEARQVLAQL